MFSIPGFALMRALGQQRGVTDADALNRISLIGGAVGFSPIGIVVGDSLIRRELDSTPPPPPPETPPAETALVPPVVTLHAEAAAGLLTDAGFRTITFVPDSTSPAEQDIVINQDPDSGQTVPTSTVITLTVSTGEGEAAGNAGSHEKTALIAAQVNAVSDEVARQVPNVTPHVAAAVVAIKQAVDQVRGQANQPPPPPPDQAEKAAAASKQVPDGAVTTTEKQPKKSG